jgi:acyl dehydratase
MTVRVGMAIPALEISSVNPEKMKTMAALLNDSNPIHFDVQAVKAMGLGDRPINQGPTNMAYVMTMLCNWAGGYQRLRALRVRFVANVHAGDALRASGVVTAVQRAEGQVRADCSVRLDVIDGVNVLLGDATVVLNEVAQA